MHRFPRRSPALFLLVGLALSVVTAFAEAPSYRVFRGFKLGKIPADTFPADFSRRFVPETPRVMAKHSLVSYVPALLPRERPAGLPDEIAIVVYGSAEAYARGRNDPERIAYGALHWEYFEDPSKGGRSKSDTARPFARTLEAEVPVDVTGGWVDWQRGASYVFVGARKAGSPAPEFLDKLSAHVAATREAFAPHGLDGYVVVANADSEIAWLHWPSREAAERAFASPAGKRAAIEAGDLMETVMWAPAEVFAGSLDYGSAVTVRFRPSWTR